MRAKFTEETQNLSDTKNTYTAKEDQEFVEKFWKEYEEEMANMTPEERAWLESDEFKRRAKMKNDVLMHTAGIVNEDGTITYFEDYKD